jgi:hypothetical protein
MWISKKNLGEEVLRALHASDSEMVKLRNRVKELEEAPSRLKAEIEDLKLQKKMEVLEIEHLVKMKEEKNSMEIEKEKLRLNQEHNAKEMALQTNYHDKVVSLLKEHADKFQKTYEEIMKRLPNVNMEINRDVSGG